MTPRGSRAPHETGANHKRKKNKSGGGWGSGTEKNGRQLTSLHRYSFATCRGRNNKRYIMKGDMRIVQSLHCIYYKIVQYFPWR